MSPFSQLRALIIEKETFLNNFKAKANVWLFNLGFFYKLNMTSVKTLQL